MDDLAALVAKFPDCHICNAPSTEVRYRTNPPWGFDANGIPRRTRDGFLAELIEDLVLVPTDGTVVGACSPHATALRTTTGEVIEERRKTRTESSNWMVRRQLDKAQAREDLVAALGGKCHGCGDDGLLPEELRILAPERVRKELGFSTFTEWYRFLSRTEAMLSRTKLLCVSCEVPEGKPTGDPRTEAVLAYGGVCAQPDCTETENLCVITLPGTPTLRWPNGDKYNAQAKARHLRARGFPPGFATSCRTHVHVLTRKPKR